MNHVSYIASTLRPHRRRLGLSLGAMLGTMLIELAPPLILAVVIDRVVGQGQYHLLAPLMIFQLSLPLLDGVFRSVGNYTVTLLGQRVVFDLRLDLYRRVHRLSSRFMQNTTLGKLMERLRGDVQQIQMLLTNQTPLLMIQVVCGLIALGIMVFISPRLTAVVVTAVMMYVVNYKWFTRRIRKVQRRYRRKMDLLSGMAQERLAGSVVVKAFGNERNESRDFIRQNFLAERVFHRFRMLNVSYSITSSSIAWGTYLAVLLLGTRYVLMDMMTYGAVTALAAYTWRLLQPAVQLAELSNQIQQTKVSLDRIFELMEAEPDAVDINGHKLQGLRGEVVFKNLSFEYEPEKPVLRHINLTIQPGQTVALVGHTGCGKSTITNLLYRYYEAQSGQLLVDGHDIKDLDTRWYRSQLAIVPQDPIVFDTTIAQNIAYGRPEATMEEIERAARMVELSDLIDRLPHGLSTRLGEYGEKLSLGERQRLCIARAILSDPAILILDEATSSLDAHSEALIQLALKRVMKNRTCFVIAHRLSTIVDADLIVVLDQGRIVEMGNHQQLLAKPDGRYRELFETQMAAIPKVESA